MTLTWERRSALPPSWVFHSAGVHAGLFGEYSTGIYVAGLSLAHSLNTSSAELSHTHSASGTFFPSTGAHSPFTEPNAMGVFLAGAIIAGAAAGVKACSSPKSLGSDISIVTHNDLYGEYISSASCTA